MTIEIRTLSSGGLFLEWHEGASEGQSYCKSVDEVLKAVSGLLSNRVIAEGAVKTITETIKDGHNQGTDTSEDGG